MKVYDANEKVLGRICSVIAKQLLNGESVTVVNAEKAVISGKVKNVTNLYMEKIQRGDVKKGPFFPKNPDAIFRRTVRGMLPMKKAKGRNAYKKLKVYMGIPDELKNRRMENADSKSAESLKTNHITIGNLSAAIGAKKRW